jgi:hypothetical protein
MTDPNKIANDIFNREIARELIIEAGGEGTDSEVDEILSVSSNPWDAGILFAMINKTRTK